MSQGIVYIIINRTNGHKYVGQSLLSQNKVWQHHIQSAMRMSQESLHKAMRKDGNHNFMIRELDDCNENILDEREQYWIDQYKPEYNSNIEVIEKEDIIEEVIEPIIEVNKKWGFYSSENRGDGKHSGIKLQGLNIETGETINYDNARDAAEDMTGNRNLNGNILNAAKKGRVAYGYRWKMLEHKTKKKQIKAVHRITWEEYYFESVAQAIKQICPNNSPSNLYRALKSNGRYTYKGYMWFYR